MRYLFEVSSRAVAGREAEYEAWYDQTHVHEVLALPGFLNCERFERSAPDGSVQEFVAIYEVETDDPQALLHSLFAAAPKMKMTDAIDQTSARFDVLRPLGQKVSAKN